MEQSTQQRLDGAPQRVNEAVANYQNTYRHPNLRPLVVSGLYALFPDETPSFPTEFSWEKHPWPGARHPGVYLIFDADVDLRYIGCANVLGRRLNDYFKYISGRGSVCRVVHTGWRSPPRFVATITVEKPFEAGALEEYLIGKLVRTRMPPRCTRRTLVALPHVICYGYELLPHRKCY